MYNIVAVLDQAASFTASDVRHGAEAKRVLRAYVTEVTKHTTEVKVTHLQVISRSSSPLLRTIAGAMADSLGAG